jgi:beta-alanine degradation protein BauB
LSTKLNLERHKTLRAFLKAWSAKDIDAILACMSEDCIYYASIGPGPGKKYIGKEAVRAGVQNMIAHDKTEQANVSNLMISGRRAVWEWRYVSRDTQGSQVIEIGCDLIWFKGTKIAIKDAYRKVNPNA